MSRLVGHAIQLLAMKVIEEFTRTEWRVRSGMSMGGSWPLTPAVSVGGEIQELWIAQEGIGMQCSEHCLTVAGLNLSAGKSKVPKFYPKVEDLVSRPPSGALLAPTLEGAAPQLPSTSLGYVHAGPNHEGPLLAGDFDGITCIITGAVAAEVAGKVSMVFFGLPLWLLGMLYAPGTQQYSVAAFMQARAVGFYMAMGAETAAKYALTVQYGKATLGAKQRLSA